MRSEREETVKSEIRVEMSGCEELRGVNTLGNRFSSLW